MRSWRRSDDRGRADLEVRGGAPTIAQEPTRILDRDCVQRRASWTPSRHLDVSRLTNAVMLNEQLETVSALIAPGAFQPPEISLPHGLQISRSSRLDCVVWYFCYSQAIESTGAAKH